MAVTAAFGLFAMVQVRISYQTGNRDQGHIPGVSSLVHDLPSQIRFWNCFKSNFSTNKIRWAVMLVTKKNIFFENLFFFLKNCFFWKFGILQIWYFENLVFCKFGILKIRFFENLVFKNKFLPAVFIDHAEEAAIGAAQAATCRISTTLIEFPSFNPTHKCWFWLGTTAAHPWSTACKFHHRVPCLV